MGDGKRVSGASLQHTQKLIEKQFHDALGAQFRKQPLVSTGSLRGAIATRQVMERKLQELGDKLQEELGKPRVPAEWEGLPEEEQAEAMRVVDGLRPRLQVAGIEVQAVRNHPANSMTLMARVSIIPPRPAEFITVCIDVADEELLG